MKTGTSRSIAATLAAVLTIASLGVGSAEAAPASSGPTAGNATTDFSARIRHYRRGNAAAAGAVLGLFGAIAGAAAANSYYDGYYGPYGYYGGPYAYYGPRYPYGYRHHWHRYRYWR